MRNILFIICLLFCGCAGYKEPLVLVNAYNPDLYGRNSCWGGLRESTKKSGAEFQRTFFNREWIHFNLDVDDACIGYHKIEFYQSPDASCPLIKTTTQELFDRKIAAGYAPESQDAIFLIEPNGILLVDRAEYERIKPTLKPHPFDPSLCKPKPIDANGTK